LCGAEKQKSTVSGGGDILFTFGTAIAKLRNVRRIAVKLAGGGWRAQDYYRTLAGKG
jgi:hypothetical protein